MKSTVVDESLSTDATRVLFQRKTASLLHEVICLQVKAVDWPYEDTGDKKGSVQQRTIADYLAENRLDLVINLPMRNGGARAASSFITQGYRARRMAVDYSVPLITDIKCSKLFIEVSL